MVPIDRYLTERHVKQLLDTAERKHKGADYAAELEAPDAARQLGEERDTMIAEAHRLDPRHVCDAWEETVLPPAVLPAPLGDDA
jgi:hypothetical protein